jgi:uncharacterized membrane protein
MAQGHHAVQLTSESITFEREEVLYRRFLAPLSIFLVFMAFLAVPFPLEQKAHALMHGICAQTPSHTLLMGDGRLPFDARMTGIYLGFIVAFGSLLLFGRHRYAGFLSPGSLVAVLAIAGTMALDGFNSLFTDLQLPTLYQPDNRLRLFTGMGAGVGLAVMLTMLLGMSLWRRPRVSLRVTDRWWQPLALYAIGIPFGLLLLSGRSFLFGPATLLLVVSAVAAFSGLSMVAIVMIRGRENTFDRAIDLQPQIVWGLAGGVAIVAMLAAFRFAFEALTNAPPLT